MINIIIYDSLAEFTNDDPKKLQMAHFGAYKISNSNKKIKYYVVKSRYTDSCVEVSKIELLKLIRKLTDILD